MGNGGDDGSLEAKHGNQKFPLTAHDVSSIQIQSNHLSVSG